MKPTPLVVGLGLLSVVLVTGVGFLWGQTRVIERAPRPDEATAMITVEDLVGEVPERAYTPEELVRVFPSMPMVWLDYRRGGDVEMRSHVLRYDDVAMARTGVERFAEGDARWLQHLPLVEQPLPACIDEGTLQVAPGEGFVLIGRHGGSYVHVSASGWAPASASALGASICPSLLVSDQLPWPPVD